MSKSRPMLTVGEPPELKRGARGLDWEWITEQVRAAAPEWVLVGPFSRSMGSRLRGGQYAAVDPGEFDITMRMQYDDSGTSLGRWDLWMKVR